MENSTAADGEGLSDRMKRNKTRSVMILFIAGMMLVFSANNALRNLQSSLNVDGGLGTASLSVDTGASMFFGLFVAPLLMPHVKAKHGVLFTEAVFLTYAAANFYPAYFTLIPVSFLSGIGRTVFWISVSQFNLYFAYSYRSCGKKGLLEYVGHITGYFFCGYLATQLVGNIVPYAVFELSASYERSHQNASEAGYNGTVAENETGQFSVADYCGANDCQDAAAGDHSQYHPASQAALYYVMGIFVAMNLIGLVLHVIFLPDFGKDDLKVGQTEATEVYDNEAYLPGEPDVVARSACVFDEDDDAGSMADWGGDNNNNDEDDDKHYNDMNNNDDGKVDLDLNNNDAKQNVDEKKDEEKHEVDIKDKIKDSLTKMKDLWAFYLDPMELLMTAPYLQLGMNSAFTSSEITRSYISCTFGVAEVGLCMAIYGLTSLISAFVCGKVMARFGRVYPIYLAYVVNLGIYLFCLLWVPSKSSGIGIMFGLLCFSGVVDGTYQTFTAAMVPQVFPDDTEKGYNCWSVVTTLGYFIVFTWSTSICMQQKIYAHIAMLALAATTYGVIEYVLREREKAEIAGGPDVQEKNVI